MKEEHQDTVTAISLTKAQLISATLMSKAWELPSGCEFSKDGIRIQAKIKLRHNVQQLTN